MKSPNQSIVRCRSRFARRPDVLVPLSEGQSLFDALRAAGQPIASSCAGDSVCARCRVTIQEGAGLLASAAAEERRALLRVEAEIDERLACRITPSGAGLVIGTTYW